MTRLEALDWINGKRSMINLIPRDPFETWQIRIAEADAAMVKQAYYVLKAQALERMEVRKMIQIKYKNCLWRSDDFNYSPGTLGSYYNPPEPTELEIDSLEVAYSSNLPEEEPEFEHVPGPIKYMMEEDGEFMKLFEIAILDAAREYEPRDSCPLAGEDSCG